MTLEFLGLYRETLHSPQRELDDLEILKSTAEELKKKGIKVTLLKPEEFLKERKKWENSNLSLIFAMCERKEILKILESFESSFVTELNPSQSIWNTYRYRMVSLLNLAKVSFPVSELVSTHASHSKNFNSHPYPFWVKRGDVHNTQAGDVSLVKTAIELENVLSNFKARGISQAVLQEHLNGDLVKFYGIGSPAITNSRFSAWFKWFYHKDQDLKKHQFSEDLLKKLTQSTAQALGLEIYGGDAVVLPDGKIFVIDINAWPSFALFRAEAASAIASYLLVRSEKKARVFTTVKVS